MFSRIHLRSLAFVAGAVLAVDCGGARAAPLETSVPSTWYRLTLELVRHTPGYAPPVASRTFAYMGVALHEAVVPGVPGGRSLAGQLNGLGALPQPVPGEQYDWVAVAHAALARTVAEFFSNTGPSGQTALRSVQARLDAELAAKVEPAVLERSLAHGRSVAEAVIAWSLTDGGADGRSVTYPSDYVVPSGAADWVSLTPTNSQPLLPYWGRNRPFALRAVDECRVAPPPEYSEAKDSAFYAEALEVYETAGQLNAEQRRIARFWADDAMLSFTPPGHWVEILRALLEERGAPLAVASEAYARLGIATADAFIAGWDAKYEYNLLRPVTYIQRFIDPEWEPLLITPPFPEYPSGHSVLSGAAAEVLGKTFGENFGFVDHALVADGMEPRAFASFRDAAREAAMSRLYGGIHYRAAIDRGIDQGRCVGEKANQLRFR